MLQLEPLERRAVVGERHLVLGATIEELEHAFRKSLFRDLAQVEDVVAVVQAAHSRFSISPNDDSGIPCVNTGRTDPRATFGAPFELSHVGARQFWSRSGLDWHRAAMLRWTNFRHRLQ